MATLHPVQPMSAAPARQADAFALLAELSRDFAQSLDLDPTLHKALERIAAHIGAEAGSLFLLEASGDELLCRACVGELNLKNARLSVAQGVIGRCVRHNRCEMVRDAVRDPHFHADWDRHTGFRTRSLLCAPLSVQDRCLGAIELVNKQGGDGLFGVEDQQLLQVLAASAALAISNAQLAEQLVEKERWRRELELAAEIQRGLLPKPPSEAFPIRALNRPARIVSGDFYDFFALSEDRLAFCVGDVSGKGMNAALLMAKTASLYRCLGKEFHDLGALLSVLNRELCETATRGMFVTLAMGIYEPHEARVRLLNAGHEPPMWLGAEGDVRLFPAQFPPLGVDSQSIPRHGIEEQELKLRAGTLYVFSDGLSEARDAQGKCWGAEGVRAALQKFSALPLEQRLQSVVSEVETEGLRDDLTLLALEAPQPASGVRTKG